MKKMIALALVFVFALALVGCFGGRQDSDYLTGNYPVITWYAWGDRQSDHALVMGEINNILRERIGAELQITFIDFGAFDTRVGLAISAGEEFDIVFTSNWLNPYVPNVLTGAFLPLDNLIDTYAPGLRSALPATVLDVARYRGELFAIPNYQVIFGQYGFLVQRELAERYNLNPDEINQLSDIEWFLEIIVENYPNLFPFRPQSHDKFRETFEEISPVPVYIRRGDETLTPIARVDAPEDRETVAFMADWFQRGFIRRDLLTVMDDDVDVRANRYAVMAMNIHPATEGDFLERTGREYIAIPFTEPYINAMAGISAMVAISRTSPNPDLAIQLIYLMNTDEELFNLLLFGIEDRHFTRISSNQVSVIPGGGWSLASAAWQFGNQFNAWYMDGQEPGIWTETDRLNRESQVSPIRGFMFDTENVRVELAQIMAVESEFRDDTLFARSDWESAWEQKRENMHLAGIDRVIEEIERQLAEFVATR